MSRHGEQIDQTLRFASNLRRLLGIHDLEQTQAARLLGLSKASFSAWNKGRRQPSFPVALKIADYFEVPAERLATAEFGDLLEHELADRGRFERVEKKILDVWEREFEETPLRQPPADLMERMIEAVGEEATMRNPPVDEPVERG